MTRSAQEWLEADVTVVEGVGTRLGGQLRRIFGIRTVRDLLEHYPHSDKYRDVGAEMRLAEAQPGEPVTIVGTIRRWDVIKPRSRGRRKPLTIAKATLTDADGSRVEVPFFNQEWRQKQLPEGSRVAVSGTFDRFRSTWQLKNAQVTLLGDAESAGDQVDRIQPTYPATEALPSWRIARLVAAALESLPPLPDFLPAELRERRGLIELDTALRHLHRPTDLAAVGPARDRLVYDELLCLQVGLQRRRRRLEAEALGLSHPPAAGGTAERLLAALPFQPTAAQQRAFSEIGGDLGRPKPMHRLLQGEVGSGKTLVAAWSMLRAMDAGRQAVLMAPTTVLAEQHFQTFTSLLAPLGVNAPGGVRCALLTSAVGQKHLRGLLAQLAVGDIDLLIGTHALLEERVRFADLGMVVIDEQHRFGVEHRARLRDKRDDGTAPDVLVMTATPIPRSLALTLYGDLDVTVLDELPPGREPVETVVLPADSERRPRLNRWIRERAKAGERVFWVCPTIEDSEALDVASAEQTHHRLSTEVFADLEVGLVHGRLPPAERDQVMEAFRRGDVQILVATTVIEVGVDVSEATIMVVEDADRFGISQLHQLRGRIGRGRVNPDQRNYCVLFSADAEQNERLEALAATSDGFELADKDLELRGEGSLFDTRQSGLPDLKLAKLLRDYDWVVAARDDARELVARDPELRDHPALRDEVARRYGEERLAALETG